MLRVALVITELDVGGAERQLVHLATGLDRRFFKPRVYALGSPPAAGRDELVQRLSAAEVPVEFFDAQGWRHLGPTVQRLTERCREFRPQVMQSFLFHANVIGSVAARQAGVKAILLGMRVNDPSWWRSKVEGYVARRADRIISVSQSVALAVKQRLRLRDEQSVVIPNGVDIDAFEAAEPADLTGFGVPPGVRPLVFVGRLDRQKGVERLLDLQPMLEATDSHLLVVGDGPEASMLRARANSRLHFAGWQSSVAAILAACQVLVLPSRYEGMPNVVLEAMAAGLPVVVTPVEGVREILGADDPQVLPFEAMQWSMLLTRLTADALWAKQLGEQNRERVRAHFSVAAMVCQYERLFSACALAP